MPHQSLNTSNGGKAHKVVHGETGLGQREVFLRRGVVRGELEIVQRSKSKDDKQEGESLSFDGRSGEGVVCLFQNADDG
jgi:hypothetical protein